MSWTYLRVVSRSVALSQPRNDYYDVQLVLSNRSITPAGTGEGSTGGFPAPPPGPAIHYAAGHIDYMSEGYGDSGGPGATTPGANTTTAVTGDASVTLITGITYNYHFLHILNTLDLDTSHQVGLNDGGGWNPSGPHISTPGGDTTVLYEGSFTAVSGNAGVHSIAASAAGASHVPKAAAMEWWIDPEGWDTGDSPIPPTPAQWVGISPPEVVTMDGPDGTTVWPFTDGSLIVLHDGFDQSSHILSYDGACGTFTLDYTPGVGSTITVRYQGR